MLGKCIKAVTPRGYRYTIIVYLRHLFMFIITHSCSAFFGKVLHVVQSIDCDSGFIGNHHRTSIIYERRVYVPRHGHGMIHV